MKDCNIRNQVNWISHLKESVTGSRSNIRKSGGDPEIPDFQRSGEEELEAVKGLCWCIGNVLGGGSMLLKGFWHLENPGDMRRSW